MELHVSPGRLSGRVIVPGSKSHTIRGLLIGTLADGVSVLHSPLISDDTASCMAACRELGVAIVEQDGRWEIHGTAGKPTPARNLIDVGNSGTTLYLAMALAALCNGETEFTGDEQIRRRPAEPLMAALRELGATAYSRNDNGCAPLVVGGGLHGGLVTIECATSQFLSALLIACPLALGDTVIMVPLLNEKPYVEMTLNWLQAAGVHCDTNAELSRFRIDGRQTYRAFDRRVPGDFSSATFFLVAAAITGSELFLDGLDMTDTQGDRAVVGMLRQMGCTVTPGAGGILMQGPERLCGCTFDLNNTPDALPAMAVAGCFADGETRLVNVPQARIKETDRIGTMAGELTKMGATLQELPDGLIIRGGHTLRGTELDGHSDHRAVMALAVAGLACEGATTVTTAESAAVTFPDFVRLMQSCGADISEAH